MSQSYSIELNLISCYYLFMFTSCSPRVPFMFPLCSPSCSLRVPLLAFRSMIEGHVTTKNTTNVKQQQHTEGFLRNLRQIKPHSRAPSFPIDPEPYAGGSVSSRSRSGSSSSSSGSGSSSSSSSSTSGSRYTKALRLKSFLPCLAEFPHAPSDASASLGGRQPPQRQRLPRPRQ